MKLPGKPADDEPGKLAPCECDPKLPPECEKPDSNPKFNVSNLFFPKYFLKNYLSSEMGRLESLAIRLVVHLDNLHSHLFQALENQHLMMEILAIEMASMQNHFHCDAHSMNDRQLTVRYLALIERIVD